MGELNLVLFLTASLALIIAPGPDNILVLTRGVTQGRGAALVSAAGVSLGLVVHSIFAAVGLSALLAQSAVAFSVIKYVGAAYLIYLGIKVFLNREGFAVSSEATPVGLKSVFVQGVASNVLNPKVALFFLAFLPQFADPTVDSAAVQLLALGLTFALLTWMVFSAIGYFSGSLGNWLESRPGYANVLRWLTGGVLVGLGLRLAFSDRR
ncbi:MAG TPA: LysE family translocator [Rubrobacteraceae bacterium]|nr:LysE family translocator [Rubrobacteraceae bacterium]